MVTRTVTIPVRHLPSPGPVHYAIPQFTLTGGIPVLMEMDTEAIGPTFTSIINDDSKFADMYATLLQGNMRISNNIEVLNYMQNGSNPFYLSGTPTTSSISLSGGTIWDSSQISSTNSFGGTSLTVGGTSSLGGSSSTTNLTAGGGVYSSGGGSAGSGEITAVDESNYAARFASRLSLIEEYCEKYGKTVDVDEIRSEYKNDPEEGVEYCDDILNNEFNQSLLRKLVHKKYDDYNKSKQQAGAAIADEWVKSVLAAGLQSPDISSGGVNKNNVLDVIGAFALNKDVKNGKVSLENVLESPEVALALINAMKARADKALLDKDVSDEKKQIIQQKITALRVHYDMYADSIADENKHNDVEFRQVRGALSKVYMDLFGVLRMDEAEKTDAAAPQYYGLPSDSTIKFDDQVKRANDEIYSYKGRRKLKIIM